MLSTIQTKYTNGCYKVGEMHENTLWWPKNVLTNIVWWNGITLNFHKAKIKRGFHKLYFKKVIQLPNNVVVKRNCNFLLILSD
jgi:hypothetical protein